MSHYSVLVITPKEPVGFEIETKLAPYDENISVPEYISHTREELIENVKQKALEMKERYEKYLKNPENSSFNKDYYLEKYPPILEMIENDDELGLFAEAIKVYEPHDIDEFGNAKSTYNPLSKWDWYVIGGRFSGLFGDELPDCIQVKDFPHEEIGSEEDLIKKYPEEYEHYKKLLSGEERSFYRVEYLRERYPSFKDYILSMKTVVTYAVLDADDNWHEPGQMGWFGMSSASTDDEVNWDKNYYDNFIKNLPEDYWLTVVDCHI